MNIIIFIKLFQKKNIVIKKPNHDPKSDTECKVDFRKCKEKKMNIM